MNIRVTRSTLLHLSLAMAVVCLLVSCHVSNEPTAASLVKRNITDSEMALSLWRANSKDVPWRRFTKEERAEIARIRARVSPGYRKFLTIGFLGPADTFVVFVTRTIEPPDFGPESVALNECRATPRCKYSCTGRYVDGGVGVLGPSGSACEDSVLYFYSDVNLPFPLGQRHALRRYSCRHINGHVFGTCP